MNKCLLPFLASALLLCAGQSFGQNTTPNGAASDATNRKIHKLDLLIKLVPLVLRKEQFDPLLACMDKARELERAEQEREDKILAEMDPTVTDAVDNAIQKGIYPPKDLQEDIVKKLDAVGNKQIIVSLNMVNIITNTITTLFNEGQRKTMIGSFASSFINPANPASVTDDVKFAFYIKRVFLDVDAYDLLKEMEKSAK
jgi:uncharacterized protein YejL (UPF0352 family)